MLCVERTWPCSQAAAPSASLLMWSILRLITSSVSAAPRELGVGVAAAAPVLVACTRLFLVASCAQGNEPCGDNVGAVS